MKAVTMETKAWIPSHSDIGPDTLLNGDIGGLAYSNGNMATVGWTCAGEAEITVHLIDSKSLVENKVEALRAEAKNIRAEATAKCTAIESQIQNLLAISYDEEQA